MYEDCSSYKLFYTYDANGFLSGIKRVLANGTTETYAVLCNMFGDVIGIYNSSKSLVAKYTYDSWGKLLSITNASGTDITSTDGIWTQNSIRYRGYVYDNETKLYYLQSRYYDPEICRFINADDYSVLTASPTALTDKNLFAYCDCNPIVRKDTQGNAWETILDVVSLIVSIVDVISDYSNLWAWLGLVGDAIDLVPFVTGVGEAARAINIASVADDIIDGTKAIKRIDDVSDISKTGKRVFNVSKQNSKVFKEFKNVYGRPYKTSGYGRNKRFYDWDFTHNDIEVYDRNGKHLGSMDPITGKMYKDAVKGRTLW